MRRIAVALLAGALVAAPFSPRPAQAGPSPKGVALAQALATKRLSHVKFEGAKIDDVVKYLRIATGFNFVVKRTVIQKAGVDLDAVAVNVELDSVSVANLLDVVLSEHGLVAKVEGNIVFVTTKADAQGKPVTVLHPISHLTWQKTDFIGPTIDLYPSDYTPPEEYEPERLVEDDPLTDPQKIIDMVKELVDEPWETEGWSMSATKTYLMVRAPRPVQARVTQALERLAAMK